LKNAGIWAWSSFNNISLTVPERWHGIGFYFGNNISGKHLVAGESEERKAEAIVAGR